ncbi:MAG TPA: VOC family protein [Pseudomonadales bacterium]|jgi:extradiol dioxygenase family protein|nr:VOC family protein [Pseudomonadales bacterium]
MTGTIDRIRDATIRASNVAELRMFYNRVGFAEVLARGDEIVVFAAGQSELVIYRVADQPKAAVGLGFEVDDAAPIAERLCNAAIPFDGPMQLRPGMVGIRFTDPNGNVLEFFQPSAR